jgi:hypothetical protein
MDVEAAQPRPRNPLLSRDSALPLLMQRPLAFRDRYRWYLLWLLIGASCDLFSILWNLRQYGPSIEVHIVQRWLSHWLGVEAGVPIAKVIQLAFVLLVASWWRPWCRWILLTCGTLYFLASISNYFLLL